MVKHACRQLWQGTYLLEESNLLWSHCLSEQVPLNQLHRNLLIRLVLPALHVVSELPIYRELWVLLIRCLVLLQQSLQLLKFLISLHFFIFFKGHIHEQQHLSNVLVHNGDWVLIGHLLDFDLQHTPKGIVNVVVSAATHQVHYSSHDLIIVQLLIAMSSTLILKT